MRTPPAGVSTANCANEGVGANIASAATPVNARSVFLMRLSFVDRTARKRIGMRCRSGGTEESAYRRVPLTQRFEFLRTRETLELVNSYPTSLAVRNRISASFALEARA